MLFTTSSLADMQPGNLKNAARYFRAINHKLRQDMLYLLHKEGRMTVSRLHEKLDLEQSVASQHLAILRQANLVVTERDGRHKFYAVNYQQIKELNQIADELLNRQTSLKKEA